MNTDSSTRTIKLQGEIVTIGPGTVPLSIGSVHETSVKDVVAIFRKISKEGMFDDVSDS